ncbi:helix-turn-helix domain-containing protein [Alphaproteobacteria bacterium]|nr:helix-turn-helix domain-containing protein [Alphaproteobacteria bacterium]
MIKTAPSLITQLVEARKGARLTQAALAAAVGIPQSHLSKIEAGKSDIRLSTLTELSTALGLKLNLRSSGQQAKAKTTQADKLSSEELELSKPEESHETRRAYRREQDWLSID